MKQIYKLLLVISIFAFSACKDNSTDPEETVSQAKVVTASDIGAVGNGKTYYRFSDSTIVTGADTLTEKWDIAFKKTTIYCNGGTSGSGQGGAIVLKNTDFLSYAEAPTSGYSVDTQESPAIPTGSGNGWYIYDSVNHLISPASGILLVLKTGTGKYVKAQILSYYKGAPETPSSSNTSGYYTFKYFYQPDGTSKLQ